MTHEDEDEDEDEDDDEDDDVKDFVFESLVVGVDAVAVELFDDDDVSALLLSFLFRLMLMSTFFAIVEAGDLRSAARARMASSSLRYLARASSFDAL